MGTYDITSDSCLGLLVSDTYQSNDINDKKLWGVFASNYSKNIVFENVVFSRFDAHQGVYNVTLKNCRLGHQGINLIGHGTALIENTTVYSKNFITLRSDYGSTWNGDVVIRNCKYIPLNGEKCDAVLIGGSNNGIQQHVVYGKVPHAHDRKDHGEGDNGHIRQAAHRFGQ